MNTGRNLFENRVGGERSVLSDYLARSAVVRCISRNNGGGENTENVNSCSGIVLCSDPHLVMTSAQIFGGQPPVWESDLSWTSLDKCCEPPVRFAEVRQKYSSARCEVLQSKCALGSVSQGATGRNASAELEEEWSPAWPLWRLRVPDHHTSLNAVITALSGWCPSDTSTPSSDADDDVGGMQEVVCGASDFIVLRVRSNASAAVNPESRTTRNFKLPTTITTTPPTKISVTLHKAAPVFLIATPFADVCPRVFSPSVTRGVISNVLRSTSSGQSPRSATDCSHCPGQLSIGRNNSTRSVFPRTLAHRPGQSVGDCSSALPVGSDSGGGCAPGEGCAVRTTSSGGDVSGRVSGADRVAMFLTDVPCVLGSEGGAVIAACPDVQLVGFLSSCLLGQHGNWLGLSTVCPAAPLLDAVRSLVTSRLCTRNPAGSSLTSQQLSSPVSSRQTATARQNAPRAQSASWNAPSAPQFDRCVVSVHCAGVWASGVLVSRHRGVILTCRHAIASWIKDPRLIITVRSAYCGRHDINMAAGGPDACNAEASVVAASSTPRLTGVDDVIDLVFLQITDEDCERLGLRELPIQTSPYDVTSCLGRPVYAVGYPLLSPDVLATPTITHGHISRVHRTVDGRRVAWYQTSSAVNRGASGGALMDVQSSKLIAILSSNLCNDQGGDYAHVNFSQAVHLLADPIKLFQHRHDVTILTDALHRLEVLCANSPGPNSLTSKL